MQQVLKRCIKDRTTSTTYSTSVSVTLVHHNMCILHNAPQGKFGTLKTSTGM